MHCAWLTCLFHPAAQQLQLHVLAAQQLAALQSCFLFACASRVGFDLAAQQLQLHVLAAWQLAALQPGFLLA